MNPWVPPSTPSTSSPTPGGPARTATTTVVTSGTPNPSTFGGSVAFLVTVTPSAATGTVTVVDQTTSTTLGSGTLSGGTATINSSACVGGANTITATYGGDITYAPSSSVGYTQNVNKANTTTSLGVVPASPQLSGTNLTMTATPTAGTTGTVDFKDGGVAIPGGSGIAISGGTAVFNYSGLSVATHTLTAVYNGDGNYNGSTSSGVSYTINAGGATTTFDPAAVTTATLSGGNLVATMATAGNGFAQSLATHGTGKFYCEMTLTTGNNDWFVGLTCPSFTYPTNLVWWDVSGIENQGVNTVNLTAIAPAVGDVCGMAVDLTNKRLWFRRISGGSPSNWNNNPSADPNTPSTGEDVSAAMTAGSPTTFVAFINMQVVGNVETANFGGSAYAAAAPAGYSNW